ncbi:hypothetical protein [Actinocatenispora comari]|jgi:hypothetical protein|nr:hypothetical protein [Actinocatenispora comari]
MTERIRDPGDVLVVHNDHVLLRDTGLPRLIGSILLKLSMQS